MAFPNIPNVPDAKGALAAIRTTFSRWGRTADSRIGQAEKEAHKVATADTVGRVKPDNVTTFVDVHGTIRAEGGGGGGGLSIPGPYVDDAAAQAAGVGLLKPYYQPQGFVVIRLV